MSTIANIDSGDLITNSRADINNNFSNLNTDKMETSVLDTDTTLAANSDSKVATQKATKAYVDAQTLLNIEVESEAAATHTVTTTASQKILVWAKGNSTGGSEHDVILKYDGVQKDLVTIQSTAGLEVPFSLMYEETPGAGTLDITVTSTATIENVVIMVMKI